MYYLFYKSVQKNPTFLAEDKIVDLLRKLQFDPICFYVFTLRDDELVGDNTP